MNSKGYVQTIVLWTERINKYTLQAQVNILFRIVFNILWVLYCKDIITYEQADSLVEYGDK